MIDSKSQHILESVNSTAEPIFVIRGQDSLSVEVLKKYLSIADEEGCDDIFLQAVQARINEFEGWQANNEQKLKLPDQ